jgi:hypothetical protein
MQHITCPGPAVQTLPLHHLYLIYTIELNGYANIPKETAITLRKKRK